MPLVVSYILLSYLAPLDSSMPLQSCLQSLILFKFLCVTGKESLAEEIHKGFRRRIKVDS